MTERDKTDTPPAHAVAEDQSRQLTTPDSALNSPARQDDELNLLQALTILVGSWRLLLFAPLAMGMLTAVTLLILPARYEATATFVPEAPSGGIQLPGSIASLASQFGVTAPGVLASSSPQFYADVLRSRTIADRVLTEEFLDPRIRDGAEKAILLNILKIRGRDSAERLEKGRKRLRKIVRISVDRETNVVAITVETKFPTLSADLANLHVMLLDGFNLNTRQSTAGALRRFMEGRVEAAEFELREAEDSLEVFLQDNRQFGESPSLTFQFERHQRQVRINETLFTTLRQQTEEARIQEINDMPFITTIDTAVPPIDNSNPRLLLTVAMTLMAALAGLVTAFSRQYLRNAKSRVDPDFVALESQWIIAKRDFNRLLRRHQH